MTLLALWQRLTGAEARAIRHQRDAYAEQADVERQRADAAERELAALRRDLERAERDVTLFQGEAYHAHANAELMADALATERAARAPTGWFPGEQKPDV